MLHILQSWGGIGLAIFLVGGFSTICLFIAMAMRRYGHRLYAGGA